MKLQLICTALLVATLSFAPNNARAECFNSSDSCESQMIAEAERNRAKALGIDRNPFKAFGAWLNGTATDKQVLPPITSRKEAREWLPGGKYLRADGTLREQPT